MVQRIIKGQQQKSLPTRLAPPLDIKEEEGSNRHLIWTCVFSVFVYCSLSDPEPSKQWLCVKQAFDWQPGCLLHRKSETCVWLLPGELPDLMLAEVNSLLTPCQRNPHSLLSTDPLALFTCKCKMHIYAATADEPISGQSRLANYNVC